MRTRARTVLEARFGEASGVDELLESAIPEWCREQMVAHQRDENAAAARRLLGVCELVDARHAMLLRSGTVAGRARRAALSEVAAASTCTMHMAEVHYDIGFLMASHMPAVKGAALAGLIDYAHLVVIQRGVSQVAPEIIAALDADIAASARSLAPAALAKEIERLLMERDPRMAEGLHARERTRRRVTMSRRASGMGDVRAYLAADEAVVVDEAIDALADTVCSGDDRDRAALRADAVVAMALGADHLHCRCGQTECRAKAAVRARTSTVPGVDATEAGPGAVEADAAADAESHTVAAADSEGATGGCESETDPGRPGAQRRVHVYVHVDLATLAHLTDTPGHLEGYGPVCAEYARMLSENATWQLVFAEAKYLAEHWLVQNPQSACDAPHAHRPEEDVAGHAGTARASDSAAAAVTGADSTGADSTGADVTAWDIGDGASALPADEDPELDDPEYIAFIEAAFERWQARERRLRRQIESVAQRRLPDGAGPVLGRPRPAPPTPLRHSRIPSLRTVPVISDGQLIDTIRARVAACRGMSSGVHPDGHGGYASPPPGALSYRPSRRIRNAVRARDGHCRHPGCTVPARRCEIDHVVPFDHGDPSRGGWTVPQNLHCVCKQHHQLKTWGMWDVAVLAGNAECWTSSVTGQWMISVPAGFRPRAVPPPRPEPEPEPKPGPKHDAGTASPDGPAGKCRSAAGIRHGATCAGTRVSARDIAFGAPAPVREAGAGVDEAPPF